MESLIRFSYLFVLIILTIYQPKKYLPSSSLSICSLFVFISHTRHQLSLLKMFHQISSLLSRLCHFLSLPLAGISCDLMPPYGFCLSWLVIHSFPTINPPLTSDRSCLWSLPWRYKSRQIGTHKSHKIHTLTDHVTLINTTPHSLLTSPSSIHITRRSLQSDNIHNYE